MATLATIFSLANVTKKIIGLLHPLCYAKLLCTLIKGNERMRGITQFTLNCQRRACYPDVITFPMIIFDSFAWFNVPFSIYL